MAFALGASTVAVANSNSGYVLDQACYKMHLARGTAESQARVMCMRPKGYTGN